MKQLELLAPAGSYQTLKAVAAAGADAVYAGGTDFGARAYANNFTQEELLEAMDYLHIRGKKLYLTVNTLLKEREMEEQLYEYLLPYYEQGLDAVIVQDFGVLSFVRQAFPQMDIHASTQMTVTGAEGAAFLQEQGAKRIVTARELSLKEIRTIREKTGVEIESFVHGALCYCYSGQCLFSSMLGGRSGNRGRCAQPCRLPYEVLDEKHSSLTGEASYVLSPKDLCTVQLIPELAEAGIYSFKIEGRMKQTEYAAGVTAVYRNYIDRYLSYGKEGFQVSTKDRQQLLDLGNRSGFTDGYYKRHNGPEMITFEKPNHAKGKTEQTGERPQEILQEKIKGKLILSKGKNATLTVSCGGYEVTATGEILQEAKSKPLEESDVRNRMYKTGNMPFVFEELQIEMEDGIFLPNGQLNALRREALGALETKMLEKYRRNDGFSPLGTEGKQRRKERKPECRVALESLEGLSLVCSKDFVTGICLEEGTFSEPDFTEELRTVCTGIHQSEKECYLMLPYIFRQDTSFRYEQMWQELSKIPLDGMIVRNYEELGFLKSHGYEGRIQADSNLYTYSNRTHEAFWQAGISQDTLPLELNYKELLHRNCEESEMLIYGRIPLMITAGCVAKSLGRCQKKKSRYFLKDRYGKEFSIKTDCTNCYNLIYNSQPLALFGMAKEVKKIHPASYRLHFTGENLKQMEEILELFRRVYVQNQPFLKDEIKFEYTNGHMKRGVE